MRRRLKVASGVVIFYKINMIQAIFHQFSQIIGVFRPIVHSVNQQIFKHHFPVSLFYIIIHRFHQNSQRISVVYRHQFGTGFIIGRMQRNGQVRLKILLGEFGYALAQSRKWKRKYA